jgi:hypothetical protein
MGEYKYDWTQKRVKNTPMGRVTGECQDATAYDQFQRGLIVEMSKKPEAMVALKDNLNEAYDYELIEPEPVDAVAEGTLDSARTIN